MHGKRWVCGLSGRHASAWLAAAVVLAACGEASPRTPVDAGDRDTWVTAAPGEVGLDAAKLDAARAYAFQDDYYTQAVLVVRHGYLVAEWYAEDSGPDALANSWSIGKSFASTLIGMAIAAGQISGVDVSMAEYVPAWAGTEHADITLHDVLAMSSGLDWVEEYDPLNGDSDGESDVARMVLEPDPLAVALDQPVRDPAGEVWSYSSGDTMLLGHVLRQTTGKTAAVLAQEQIAAPLAFREFHWWQDATGTTYTFCCVDATARDFAKFGQLYLQGGVWGGRQLVPAAWVADATSPQAQANAGYGYQWWLNRAEADGGNWPSLPESTYFALGHNGQYVAVVPELDMVIVRMGQYNVPDTDDWVAEHGLFAAGMFSDDIGVTGTRGPEGDWSDDHLFGLIAAAVDD